MTLRTLPQIDFELRKRIEFHKRRGTVYNPVIPPILHPRQHEREYFRELLKIFNRLFDLTQTHLVSRLPQLLSQAAQELEPQRFDTADEDLTIIIDGILVEFGRELSQDELKRIAKSRGISVSEFNRRQNNKIYKRLLDVDVFTSEPWLVPLLDNFASENAARITTLSQTHINDVRGIVSSAIRQGLPVREVIKQISDRVGATKANIKLIARDQISKLNGKLTELRQRDVGVSRYKWRDSNDSRVRRTHAAHDGETFKWDDAPRNTGHPGEDFQCRCYAEPILQDLVS